LPRLVRLQRTPAYPPFAPGARVVARPSARRARSAGGPGVRAGSAHAPSLRPPRGCTPGPDRTLRSAGAPAGTLAGRGLPLDLAGEVADLLRDGIHQPSA